MHVPEMQDLLAMTWREVEELWEAVERLKRDKEAVRRSLEEAARVRNRQAEELLKVSDNNKILSKWGLKNMRGKHRLAKELLEVRAGNKTLITALKDELQQTESNLETANGKVLELLEQLKAQEEHRQGDLKKEARETRRREVQ